ncbi:hypothetical protein AWB78_07690 [Caballeronia calidae]|uniref:Uncharacterized protein n=1 Tax=Caballeronia calidae TaxID=1777139 RepID=A0A158EIN0_9BURK|nr:hypothetical protein AWB78_07690 [Caballeronia calidae]
MVLSLLEVVLTLLINVGVARKRLVGFCKSKAQA